MTHPVTSPQPIAERLSLHDEVRRLMQNWSVEMTPRETQKLGTSIREYLPRGTRVYVTWVAGTEFDASVAAAARLREAGMEPVPHLAARAIRDQSMLEEMLRRLCDEAGVRQVLVIGGALSAPRGIFNSTIQVLDTGLLAQHGIQRVGVGAHPEGSPDISGPELAEALVQKNAYCARTGTPLELTTQFCFDAAPIVQWERSIRSVGNRLPVAVGLAGLAGITTLIRHARNCGVGNSINVLVKQSATFLRLASSIDPSQVLLGLARARQVDRQTALERVHFFPFGALQATARYAQAIEAGRFELVDSERRMVVKV